MAETPKERFNAIRQLLLAEQRHEEAFLLQWAEQVLEIAALQDRVQELEAEIDRLLSQMNPRLEEKAQP